MQHPNQHGVYKPDTTIEFARRRRSYVQARIALCDDGRYRFGLTIHTSYSGRSSPISQHSPGYATCRLGEEAALAEALTSFPKPFPGDPAAVRAELAALAADLRAQHLQPSLF
jgi:hypothetical protein